MPVDHYTDVLPWENLECTIDCPQSVTPGIQFSYSIHITNRCGILVHTIRFIANLSQHVTFVSASDNGIVYPVIGTGGLIRWEYDEYGQKWDLPPNGTKTFTATVTVNAFAPVGDKVIRIEVAELLAHESIAKGPVEAFSSVRKGSSGKGWRFLAVIIEWLSNVFRSKKP